MLSDEVYSQMVYDGDFASIATEPGMFERTVLLDGCSKTFAMTGWRCGFAAVPEPLVDPLVRFFTNSTSCVPPFVQHAAVAALEGPMDEPAAMMRQFRVRSEPDRRRAQLAPGVSCRMPPGAFYAFPNVGALPVSAPELAARLLEERGVAVLAGTAFGDVGREHLRLSYANSQENITEAIERMRGFIAELCGRATRPSPRRPRRRPGPDATARGGCRRRRSSSLPPIHLRLDSACAVTRPGPPPSRDGVR